MARKGDPASRRGGYKELNTGYCPGCGKSNCFLTIHHIIPRRMFRRARTIALEMNLELVSGWIAAAFADLMNDLRPPLIKICWPCHCKIEVNIRKTEMARRHPILSEQDYYGAVQKVVGKDCAHFVEIGEPFGEPIDCVNFNRFSADQEEPRRKRSMSRERFPIYQPMLSVLTMAYKNGMISF